jgi:hypothetical protein
VIDKAYTVLCDGNWTARDHAADCVLTIGPEHTSQKARYAAKRAGWKRTIGKGRWDSRDLSPQCAAREDGLSNA